MECYYCHKKGYIKKNYQKFKLDQKKKKEARTLLRLELQQRTKQNFFRFHQVNRSQIHRFLILIVPFICVQTGIGLTHTRRRMKVKSSWEQCCMEDRWLWHSESKDVWYDGIIHTFSNVLYVPPLKKNQISLGTLGANGHTYSSSGGKIKICKGSLVIM